MTLHDFIKVIRQRWIVILAATLVAAAVMWIVTPATPSTAQKVGSYTATATLLVSVRQGGEGSVSLERVKLFITTGDIPVRAAERLEYRGEPAVLASRITVTTEPAAQAMRIAATDYDGNRAAEIANGFADTAVEYFAERPAGASNVVLSVLERAVPIPNAPEGAGFVIPPSRPIRTALAALIGALFGLAIALLLDRLDSRLRTRAEVHEALHMPVIAEVPRLARGDRTPGRLGVVQEPLSVYADGYRAARSAIIHMPSQQVPGEWTPPKRSAAGARDASTARVVLVTSAYAGEGKTTSVANLAASFAETGQSVLVLDGDLRSPDTHHMFDVPQGAGISDYLSDVAGSDLQALIRPTNVAGVTIMTAGTRLDYPASLVSRMGPLLQAVRQLADVVIIDSAPLLAASDVFDILPMADTVVLVVRSGRLNEAGGNRVAELLGRFQVPVVGAILVGSPMRRADGYAKTYGYGYSDAKKRSEGGEAEPSKRMRLRPAAEARVDAAGRDEESASKASASEWAEPSDPEYDPDPPRRSS